MKMTKVPTYEDVEEAANILDGVAHRTPVLTSRTLNNLLGNSIQAYIKPENFQRMGAFKFRGGYNALAHLSPEQRQCGVLTFSSGNHAQAIALSAQILGMDATIIMPKDAPKMKVEATGGYGGNIILYDRYTEDRDVIARKVQKESGAIFIPPYDHEHVISGQGTAAKELFEDVDDGPLDYLFVCVGGGGLVSGCALAAHHFNAECKVIGVEPEAGNDAQQSMAAEKIIRISTPETIADGAQTQHIGNLTFAIMRDHVDTIMTVTDAELVEQMRFFGERMKMIIEPTGGLSLAGLRKAVEAEEIPPNSRCGVIISGGNVDLSRYSELVQGSSN